MSPRMLVGLAFVLLLAGLGMVLYGTPERQVFVDQEFSNITVYKAYPWTYNVGELPAGSLVAMPGFTGRQDITIHLIETETGQEVATVLYGTLDYQTTRAGRYKLLLELTPLQALPGQALGGLWGATDVTFSFRLEASRLVPAYPLRPVGIGLVIAGIALAAYTWRRGTSTPS